MWLVFHGPRSVTSDVQATTHQPHTYVRTSETRPSLMRNVSWWDLKTIRQYTQAFPFNVFIRGGKHWGFPVGRTDLSVDFEASSSVRTPVDLTQIPIPWESHPISSPIAFTSENFCAAGIPQFFVCYSSWLNRNLSHENGTWIKSRTTLAWAPGFLVITGNDWQGGTAPDPNAVVLFKGTGHYW